MDQKLMPLISKVKAALSELEAACSGGAEENQEQEPQEMPEMKEESSMGSDKSDKMNLVKSMFKKKGY